MSESQDKALPTILAKILARKREEISERRPRTSEQTWLQRAQAQSADRKSTRLNSSHMSESRMPSSA